MCGWENAPLWWELSDRIEPWTRKIVQKGLGVSRWLHLCHLTVIMEPKKGCEIERFALLCYLGSTHPMDENRVLCFASMRKAFSTSSGILRATCPVDRCFPTVCLWYNVNFRSNGKPWANHVLSPVLIYPKESRSLLSIILQGITQQLFSLYF